MVTFRSIYDNQGVGSAIGFISDVMGGDGQNCHAQKSCAGMIRASY
jgi:hypothetical protein